MTRTPEQQEQRIAALEAELRRQRALLRRITPTLGWSNLVRAIESIDAVLGEEPTP